LNPEPKPSCRAIFPKARDESDIDKATNRFSSSTNTTYDESGNVITDNKFRNLSYRYDANGRQIWTQNSNGVGSENKAVYDAGGNRVATQVNGQWRYSVYDVNGNLAAEYGQQQITTEKIRYYLQDHQASTRVVMNQTATVISRTDYQAFGEEIGAGVGKRTTSQGYSQTDNNRQRYAMTERDDATGLDHTWFRKYDNKAGRWTSPDPSKESMSLGNPQSFNRYSYVENNPVNAIDPSGLFCYIRGMRWSWVQTDNGAIGWLDIDFECVLNNAPRTWAALEESNREHGMGEGIVLTHLPSRVPSLDLGCFAACMADVGFNTLFEWNPATGPIKATYDFFGIELNPVQAILGYEEFGADSSFFDLAASLAVLHNNAAQVAGARAEGEIGRAEDLMSRRGATAKQIKKQTARIKSLKRVTRYARRSVVVAIIAIALDKVIDSADCYLKCRK